MKFAIALLIALTSVSAQASADLAKTKKCMTCHTVDRKLVGPAFKDVANRYTHSDKSAIVTSIKRGGAGKWGAIPMPAQPLTDEEALALAEWVLKQK